MPRVHFVKKARKDNPAVDAGESYYWWKFRYQGKRYSKTRPRRSQLTQSGFLSTLYDLEDNLPSEMTEDDAQELYGVLDELYDECQNSLDNMPYHLQDASSSGELLQERIDGLEGWMAEINGIDWEATTPAEAAEMIEDANPGIG